MTRKQLVHGLRALNESAVIDNIQLIKRTGAVKISYHNPDVIHDFDNKGKHLGVHAALGQLIISTPPTT